MSDQSGRFPTDMFAEFDRLRQQLDHAFRGAGGADDIRATGRSTFPAVNVGGTGDAIEIIALAPGVDPAKVDITIDKGLLRISGERRGHTPEPGKRASVYAQERFSGPFSRVISLPADADPDRVGASYVDGCLRISIKKRESSKPRSISVN